MFFFSFESYTFLSQGVFSLSLPHPSDDIAYADYFVGPRALVKEIIPGVNLFADMFRCDPSTLVASLDWLSWRLINDNFCLQVCVRFENIIGRRVTVMRTTSSGIHIHSDDEEKMSKVGPQAFSVSPLPSPPPPLSLSLFLFPSLSEEAIQVVDPPQAGVGPHTQDTPFKIKKTLQTSRCKARLLTRRGTNAGQAP